MDDDSSELVEYWTTKIVQASAIGCALVVLLTVVACAFGVIILGQAAFNS